MSEIIAVTTKLLLSGVLALLAALLVWQVWRIWGSRTLVLAPFDFLENGNPSVENGEQFARMIRADLVQLADLYNAGEVTNAAVVPSADRPDPAVPMNMPVVFDTSFFETIELKAYGIEFGSILKTLRRHVESPSEITGNVAHQGENYSVFVELKRPGAGADSLRRWNIAYTKNVPEATHSVACRIFRVLAVTANEAAHDAEIFRKVDDEDFCLFNVALASYDQYRLRKAVLTEEGAKNLLDQTNGPLANLLGRNVVTFPYVHKLAALVYYEQKKYAEAETAVERYNAWLQRIGRSDKSTETLRISIKARKLQTTPAVSRLRPLQPGSSIGPLLGKGGGMICCVVKDAAGRRYILSALNVLGADKAAKIVQPAVNDGGAESDVVGEVDRITETVALARIHTDVDVDARVLNQGAIMGLESTPAEGQDVVTYGFDGQRKDGKVFSVQPTPFEVESGSGIVSVAGGVFVSGIFPGAQVGGPVMTADGKLIGMVYATGGPGTLVLPVEPLLKELALELVR